MDSLPRQLIVGHEVDSYLANPAQALLISGTPGSGKYEYALNLAQQLVGDGRLAISKILVIEKEEDKQTISIDQIRTLIKKMSLKSHNQHTRVIIIKNSEFMNTEAQNALLKLLEEPGKNVYFILTCSRISSLLPTIRSRCTQVSVRTLTLGEALSMFPDIPATDVTAGWYASGGIWYQLQRLLGNEQATANPLIDAKNILKLSIYDRFLAFDKITKDRAQFQSLLDNMLIVLHSLSKNLISKGSSVPKNLITSEKLLIDSIDALSNNANARLVAINLGLKLKV